MGMEVLDGREVDQGVQLREGECVRSLQRRCVVELETLSEYQEPRHVDRHSTQRQFAVMNRLEGEESEYQRCAHHPALLTRT